MTKQLNPKALRLALKRADGIEYLMRRFEFVSEDALMSAIRRMNPDEANDFIKTLKKKQRKYAVSEEVVDQSCEEDISACSEEYSVMEQEVADTFSVEETTDECERKDVGPMLEELRQEEEKLSAQVCALEGEHKELAAKRRDLREIFREADAILEKLEAEVAAQREKVKDTYEAYQACAQAMKLNDEEQQLYRLMLDDVRERRTVLERVTIFVYEDGSVCIENAELPSVEGDALREEVNRLLEMPEAESFTVKTVKNIARLRLAVEAFGDKAELVFDSSELQIFWETVVAA